MGDNVIANLWAEPAEPRPSFHEKAKVENYVHQQVCSHAMTLAADWLAMWRKIEAMPASAREDNEPE